MLQDRGITAESPSLAHLEAQGVTILKLRDLDDSVRASAGTRVATESGASNIPRAGDAA